MPRSARAQPSSIAEDEVEDESAISMGSPSEERERELSRVVR